jgi:hypothetical protein
MLKIRNIPLNKQYQNILNVKTGRDRMEETSISNRKHENLVTFTYAGKQMKQITEVCKDTELKTTYSTNNSGPRILKHKSTNIYTFKETGTYQLTCPD